MIKIAEGSFNKVFLLTMDTGKQIIARIPHPNIGPAHYTTASEVATMHYLRTKLQLPVPHVISYSCDATNPVGSEYILMERIAGVNLSTKWETLNDQKKNKILDRLAQLQSKLLTIQFSSYGNLYFTTDIQRALCAPRMYKNASPDDNTYCIGPTTESMFWKPDRSGNRGPCMILHNLFNAKGLQYKNIGLPFASEKLNGFEIMQHRVLRMIPCVKLIHKKIQPAISICSTAVSKLPLTLNHPGIALCPHYGMKISVYKTS